MTTANESFSTHESGQSAFVENIAKILADEVDSGWWNTNRERILHSIGEGEPSFDALRSIAD